MKKLQIAKEASADESMDVDSSEGKYYAYQVSLIPRLFKRRRKDLVHTVHACAGDPRIKSGVFRYYCILFIYRP